MEQKEVIRSKLGFRPEEIVLGYVGTFQSWHGIDSALDALSSLQKELPNLRMLLVGPAFEEYAKSANEKGLARLCVFTGPVSYEQVPDYINACDIMLALYNPAKDEIRRKFGIGSPIKVLEYMACGKPVISTRVKPIDSIITNDSLGLLLEPGNNKDLQEAILKLSRNPKAIEEMGTQGKSAVQANFSWASVARSISSVL